MAIVLLGVAALALVLFAPALIADAQQARKMPRLAVLFPAEQVAGDPTLAAFRKALGDVGYIEGQTIAIEYRFGHGSTERFRDLVDELVRLNPDVLVVGSALAARAAKRATQTIPVVFVGGGDPVGTGLVASLARPGGNLTGLSFAFEEGFAGKWIELLKELVPNLSRVALLNHSGALMAGAFLRDTQKASQALGLMLQAFFVEHPDQFDRAFAAMVKDRAGALVVAHSPFLVAHSKRIAGLAAKHRLPAVHGSREFADAGGLISYGVSLPDLWRRSATYIDKILRGAKPGDLPVERPTRFELVINRKTAKALGLTIPSSLLLRADQLIE